MSKTVLMAFKFDPKVAKALRDIVKRPHTLSGFAQDAIVKAIKAYREPLEEEEVLSGGLPPLDRWDGVPMSHATDWPEAGWKEYWAMTVSARGKLDAMRIDDDRAVLTDAEWNAIVKQMGNEPGWRKAQRMQWGEGNDK